MIQMIALVMQAAALSQRAVSVGESPSERLLAVRLIAPGAAPVLSFRYFDAADRGRASGLGLMTDDAGH